MKIPQSGPQGPFAQWSNFAITIDTPGQLDTLRINPAPRRAPGYGEIEIEVRSVALGYEQALQALGMLPAPTGEIAFGKECAGVITEVGLHSNAGLARKEKHVKFNNLYSKSSKYWKAIN